MGFGNQGDPNLAQVRYAGYDFAEDARSGKICNLRYRVPRTLVSNFMEALDAPGIPRLWEKLNIFGREYNLTCKNRRVLPESDGNEKDWTVEVTFTYDNRTLSFFNDEEQLIEWRIGTQAVHEDVSAKGKYIGATQFWDNTAREWLQGIRNTDENAELGYDRLRPTLEFSVRQPRSRGWNPILASQMMGTVNNAPISLKGVIFPRGSVLFISGGAVPVGPLSSNYEVSYYFMSAYKLIPPNNTLSYYEEDTATPWTGGNFIPIRYVTWPRWNVERDANGDVGVRYVTGMSVAEAYPETDFTLLRI